MDTETVLVQFTPQDDSAPASLWALKAHGSEFNQIVEEISWESWRNNKADTGEPLG